VTIEVPLTADKWVDVLNHSNAVDFDLTLKELGWVGITFGGCNFFGHGMNMYSGSSTITVLDYHIE
jgi:hypothetical protein